MCWALCLLDSVGDCKGHLGDGQNEGGEGAGHPAGAEEVDDEPGEHLHGQDVAQQESKEGGLSLEQLHVLGCPAQGSEVLNELGLPWGVDSQPRKQGPRWLWKPPQPLLPRQAQGLRPKGTEGQEHLAWGVSWFAAWWRKLSCKRLRGYMSSRKSQNEKSP